MIYFISPQIEVTLIGHHKKCPIGKHVIIAHHNAFWMPLIDSLSGRNRAHQSLFFSSLNNLIAQNSPRE
tara:strand:- start:258 stop:464 length:207 start_codon:yes stop_codon:yes gene_type:complete